MQLFKVIIIGASLIGSALSAPTDINAKAQALTVPRDITVNETLITPNGGVEKRANCLVNAAYRTKWNEHGLVRQRVDFSSVNTPQQWFCDNWCPGWNNVQCGWDAQENGGSWRLDASNAAGLFADQFQVCVGNTLTAWMKATGCATG